MTKATTLQHVMETVKSKHSVERSSKTMGVMVKSYRRSDNGIFKSAEFKNDLQENDQTITYCGVGAHNQNGVAERYIRTFVEKARTVLLNAHARWPEHINMELWTFALRHVTTQWNNTPRKDLGYKTPDEVFNRVSRINSVKSHFKYCRLPRFDRLV